MQEVKLYAKASNYSSLAPARYSTKILLAAKPYHNQKIDIKLSKPDNENTADTTSIMNLLLMCIQEKETLKITVTGDKEISELEKIANEIKLAIETDYSKCS